MTGKTCFLCDGPAAVSDLDNPRVACLRCGRYELTHEGRDAWDDLRDGKPKAMPERLRVLRGHTRWDFESRLPPRRLSRADFESPPRRPSTQEIADRLLIWIADKTNGSVSATIKATPANDFPLIFGNEAQDFLTFAYHLRDRGLATVNPISTEAILQLTIPGWARVDELRCDLGTGAQGFVAMWFSDDVRDAWENGLRVGIERAGYDPVRVDDKEHNDKIDDRIIAEIRRSRFVVADFTGHRGGVYFEAGYAMGRGMPVIWTVREDAVADLHFDTRQYNHIVWKTVEDLAEKLKNRIEATIGKGPRQ